MLILNALSLVSKQELIWISRLSLEDRAHICWIMTVGLGSQIYLNKSIYSIFNICPVIYLVFIGIELKLFRFSIALNLVPGAEKSKFTG